MASPGARCSAEKRAGSPDVAWHGVSDRLTPW